MPRDLARIQGVLKRIERRVEAGRFFPIIGAQKGELLYAVVLLSQPSKVLELGTGIGYSCLQIVRGLPEGAQIITVERSPEYVREALMNLREAGVEDDVDIVVDDAENYVASSREVFDLIFMDIDKSDYLRLLPFLIDRLRIGGVLTADNALRPELGPFRRAIGSHPKLSTAIIEIQDGVSVSLRVS